jgi:FMN phosphatase YigB (HAD superfamily)
VLGGLAPNGHLDSHRRQSALRNQRAAAKLNLPVDLIAASEDWGASKPQSEFFRKLISAAPCEADRILYVGDRLDNDLEPAKTAGLRTAFIRRGPWAYLCADHPGMAAAADWRLTSLAELPPILAKANRLR